MKKFYACASPMGWWDREALNHAYSIKKNGGGFLTLKAAGDFVAKQQWEKDGNGYFDLKVLTSNDGGKTFQDLD